MTYSASGQVVEVPHGGTPVVLALSNLSTPDGVAVDGAGDVFVSDTGNNRVLELPNGGSQVLLPFNGLLSPRGIAIDGSGDVFLVDSANNRVLELPKGGSQAVLPFSGLNLPSGIAVSAAGDVFVADSESHRLLKLPKGGTQAVVPINGMTIDPVIPSGVTIDGGGNVFVTVFRLGVVELVARGGQTLLPFPGLPIGLGDPRGVAVDNAGDVFVTSPEQNVVLELTSGGAATFFPPNSLARSVGIAADDAGNAFVSDSVRNAVVELPHGGGAPMTLPFSGLNGPTGVAVDGSGDVFVADSNNNRVVELPKGGAQVTVPFHGLTAPVGLALDAARDLFVTAGTAVVELTSGGAQVTLPFTALADAVGVAVDGDGNVFVADAGRVLDVPCVGAPCQVVELHHGGGQTRFAINASSIFDEFPAVAVDHAGNLFIAGPAISEVLKGADPSSMTTLPIAVNNPHGVAVDRAGDVFVVDPALNSVQILPIDQGLFLDPVNGQLNVDTTRPFTWSTIASAQGYYLTVGTTLYGKELVDSGILPPSRSSFAVPPLPSGRLLYATLYTEEGGTWTRVQVVGFTAADRMAAFAYPINGQANVDTAKPFTWTADSNGQAYILVVGTTKFGHDLVNSGILPPTQRSYAVHALPGGLLYATLLTRVDGAWTRYREAIFTAATGGALFTHPVNGQLAVDTAAPFTWSSVANAQGYQLIVGTTVYGHDLVNSAVLSPIVSSYSVPALPTGHVLYATVYTEVRGNWVNYNVIGFTAAARSSS